MRNILAIVQKELRSYFASPIAYVILGMFALLFGWFYVAILNIFVQQSMQMGSMGMGGPVNVNQQMIRYVFQNSLVVNLFVVPLITMRTYAEEKRSGTIELLMTSPLTDFQIIMGKFIGALAIYASMLAVTLVHMAVLFVYGNPEWKPIATAYLGMLLMGGCFLAVGLLFSSLTKNQIVAAMITFSVLLLLWVIDWIGSLGGPTVQQVVSYLSITGHFDDFAKGVIDTTHVVYYLSFITFGLFLTAKAVDSERWRG
ncbi:MAG: ABC transporter permease subunit [Acidobacteria bacterium]|nr:ABC transporter permease subunit [Acidobacteriota bacterium]